MAKKLKVKVDLEQVNTAFKDLAESAAKIQAEKVKYPTIESFKEAAEKTLGIPLVVSARGLGLDAFYLDIVTPTGAKILSIYVSDYGHGFEYGGTAGPFQEMTDKIRALTR
jgi:hypothetical protein